MLACKKAFPHKTCTLSNSKSYQYFGESFPRRTVSPLLTMKNSKPEGTTVHSCQSNCQPKSNYSFRYSPTPKPALGVGQRKKKNRPIYEIRIARYPNPTLSLGQDIEPYGPFDEIRAAYEFKRQEHSLWTEYIDSQGRPRWIQMKPPTFDSTDPVSAVSPRAENRERLQKPKFPSFSYSPEKQGSPASRPYKSVRETVPLETTVPVSSLPQIRPVENAVLGNHTPSDIYLPNGQEMILLLTILFLVVLVPLARLIRSRLRTSNVVAKKEADDIFENLCELRPSKFEEWTEQGESKARLESKWTRGFRGRQGV
ncbi:hypothetical protein BKA64DRAFT_680038 [Cadophora sp. MPI-SDFR-AT-0126]|nr:hypothetical protein BKA64DRAFT_680038 [Leotiomycetes sp. MPI-SDFR-AT-0126]